MAALAGSKPPLSVTGTDEGAAPTGEMLNRMLLLLEPSAAQKQALATELANLQDPSSPVYHDWLTPAAFASKYSNSTADVAAVVAWLQSEGFQVQPLPAGRGWVEFSGTVAQAENAFRVKIDNVSTASGAARPVAMGVISVPAALKPVIAGLVSLDGIVSTPALTAPEPVEVSAATLEAETSPGGADALTPRLVAQLIHLNGLESKGVEGAGQSIAIVSQSDVNSSDVAAYRAAFGLPASALSVKLSGPDPGLTDGQAEATLAASWAGAAAPKAQIVLVPAATTSATDGVDLSLAAIVDQDLATTAALGYSSCEAELSPAHQAFYTAVYQQAAAEGIAVIAAAGDSGAAACHVEGSAAPVRTGYAVNALASTSWDTAVGVASFGSSGPAAGNQALAAWSPLNAADPADAGGGGSSALYAAPSWQPVPAHAVTETTKTGKHNRLLPDLALPTAIDSSANPGLAFCLSTGSSAASGCTLMRSGGSAAAASIFAGISALIDEEHGVQGNLDPGLYALTVQNGVYTDVQQGSAQLKCTAGSPDCGTAGTIGYSANAGYDLATGLGVPNAKTLVSSFAVPEVTGSGSTSVTLAISPVQTSYNPSASITLTATVTGTAGTTPTGTVTFYDSTSGNKIALPQTLSGGSASITVEGGFASGNNEMVAEYSGDTNYAAANSSAVNVNIAASSTSLSITSHPSSVTPGESIQVTATLAVGTPPAGTVAPAGVVTLSVDNGTGTYTASLTGGTTATFSSVVIPANSATSHTLSASYPANTDYLSSTSSTVTVPVSAVTPTVTVTPATTSPTPGSSLQITVAVAPPQAGETPPTGTVSIAQDGSPIGTATLVPQSPASLATVTITAPATGTHTLVATYTPDANSSSFYTTATSGQSSYTIALIPTTTTNNASTTTPALGSSVTVNTTIAPSTGSTYYSGADPSGTVTYTLDGTTEATATVAPGTPATANTSFIVSTAGTHTLTAAYSGDTHYASSSTVTSLTVSKLATTLQVTASPTSAAVGGSVVATATISTTGSGTAPTGTVTFTLGGTEVKTASVSSGVATATLTVPSAGNLTLVATYGGDTNYDTSTATTSVTATKATPTIALTPSSYAPSAGSSLTLTADITPPSTGAATPTGSVTFSVAGNAVGTATVSGGTATLTITAPAVGTYALSAAYSGDGNYNSAATSGVNITVTKGTTSITVAPASATPTAGSSMVVTATITASTSGTTVPTGTVSFTMDGSPVGSNPVSGGRTASVTITVPSTGTHTLQATYSGDSNFLSSVSSVASFTVAKTTTITVVVPSTTAPALGASLPVTIDVTPATVNTSYPSGTVTVTVDGASVGVVTLAAGSPATASFTIPASTLTPGTHAISGVYSGNTYYATSTASGVTVTVPKSPTTMTVTPSTTTPSGGSSLSVSSTVIATSPGASPPTGTVTFTLDGATAATSALIPGSPSTATALISQITPGTHVLEAKYSGDSYYASATSQSVILTVSKSPTSITISPSTLTPTAGSSMTVTASITSSSPSTEAPSGTVTISMDGVTVGTGTVVPGTPATATIKVPLVSAGTHVLVGTYSGDTYYTGSNSPTVTIEAAQGATMTTLTATPPSLTAGKAETLTATIAPVNAVLGVTYTITGTVSFYDSKTLLGTVPVASNSATLTGVALADNESHTITAVYSGDTNWLGSTSTPLPLEATTLPDIVVLSSNITTVQPGAAVVLTATVTPSATPASTGEQNPTGNVVFYNGTTVLGIAALKPEQLSDSSTATLTIQTLPGGSDTISAHYEGDLYYDAATSNLLTLTVESFTITPAPSNPATNLDIVQGGAGSVSFIIKGEGGFNDLVQLECLAPPQDDMTCSASPQQVTPTATVTFVVQTYSTPAGGGGATKVSRNRPKPLWPRRTGGLALAALFFFLVPFGKRGRKLLRGGPRHFLIVLLLLVGLGGAGIGCTGNGALTSFGTPLGVATVRVTGQAYVDNTAVSQSVYFTVNVIAPGSTAP